MSEHTGLPKTLGFVILMVPVKLFRQLHQSGVGTDVQHTAVINHEEEDKLWSSGILNVTEPKGLQQALFYVGKVYCIRGGEEQRCLKPSQFVRSSDPDCYTYTEHGSKNRSGGLAQLNVSNKQVPCYANPGNEPRCVVFLLDKYFKKLPTYAFDNDIFFRPKCKAPSSPEQPWYDCVHVGKNRLSTMVRYMCAESGSSKKTNHILRATGATTLFTAGVPERIIQEYYWTSFS